MFYGFTVRFLCAVLISGALGASIAVAANQYIELSPPVEKLEGTQIEVVEVFSYGCQHCYNLENTINPWVETLPADVKFERIPAMFGGIWDIHGRLFLTLQVMQAEPSVHRAVFEAIRHRQKLVSPDQMGDFLLGQGIDKALFIKVYASDEVQARVIDAQQKVRAYGVTGVPVLIVDRKYRFDQSAGGPEGMLRLAERLISQERVARQQP
ncbi:thiol:disulfide interchange protein DsbA/DsbL [Pseudomonas kulmbachensis]|uniref:thiol:disulfide interchange protein DsbA/DsbL n=1 Tax=Pseudomonas kulmbachensis TaxID=3043408 RepID=UPI002AAF954C|nr:thiol:disulfide interchange protein DsbA/DsbL [Pseudomonas sp. FLM 004-28]